MVSYFFQQKVNKQYVAQIQHNTVSQIRVAANMQQSNNSSSSFFSQSSAWPESANAITSYYLDIKAKKSGSKKAGSFMGEVCQVAVICPKPCQTA